MTDDPKALALELERRGKPKTSVDARAAKALRELASERERQEIALRILDEFVQSYPAGVNPYLDKAWGAAREHLRDARAALREQEGEHG